MGKRFKNGDAAKNYLVNREGWFVKRISKHYILGHDNYEGSLPIPKGKKKLNVRTEQNIIRAMKRAKEGMK